MNHAMPSTLRVFAHDLIRLASVDGVDALEPTRCFGHIKCFMHFFLDVIDQYPAMDAFSIFHLVEKGNSDLVR